MEAVYLTCSGGSVLECSSLAELPFLNALSASALCTHAAVHNSYSRVGVNTISIHTSSWQLQADDGEGSEAVELRTPRSRFSRQCATCAAVSHH